MSTLWRRSRRPLVVALMLSTVIGCTPNVPPRFYTLEATAAQSLPLPPRAWPLAIGIGPLIFPSYLDRPEIVSRAAPTRITIAELDKWAEPLDGLFARVLRENLSVLLASDSIVTLPNERDLRPDYRVEVEVLRFDADARRSVTLEARWRLFGPQGDRMIDTQRTTLQQPADGSGFEPIVTAMNRVAEGLARAIAERIRTALTGPSARPAAAAR